MLGSSRLIAFVSTIDAARARDFYVGVLGLGFVDETQFAVVLDAEGTMLRVTVVPEVIVAPYAVLGWVVPDIRGAVADLAQKGVEFDRYDGMAQDDLGIWTSPAGAKVAWFKDPDGNILSLTQF